MGVPSFYRWLLEKYPLIVQQVIEEEPLEINGVRIPVDTTKPNPNNIEYDNLYLDMNGIIHPCFHPEDMAPPTTFGEVFKRMFDYIDRLFVMVRPRKLLYLAIDGVAPRAKMNQQRSRRFRAAKDAAEAAVEEEHLRQEFEREGRRLPPKVDSQVFDSNVITPGTQFMSTLSFALQYYIHIKLNSDPGWKKIKVILSDANVPGEGEHKIMSYIRLQKNHPGYNPNARHCLYGLDADLIMLALATHEVHMSILREVVFTPGERDKCFLCGQIGHFAAECDGKIKRKAGESLDNAETDLAVKKPYQLVNCWMLREYLEHDMQIPNSQLHRSLDRIIDDFIFICFFVGNDFLPHMPTLEIREGAIELMMSVYKKEFGSTTIYLTDRSKLNLRHVEHFIQAVALFENNIFKRRAQIHQRQLERFNRDKAQASRRNETGKVVQTDSVVELSESLHSSSPQKLIRLSLDDKAGVANVQTKNCLKAEEIENSEELKFKLNKLQRDKNDVFGLENGEEDKVRLDLSGWKERYYMEKFGAKSEEETEQIRRDVVLKYTEGLCWIMHYYYHGVCSWKWFYPYHYAPFASDLKFLDKLDIKFELGSPFKPFNQLLAVLPSASAHALPECFRTLMTDPDSPIVDFYPPDPEVDMNGKRYSWQGIMKLPFIKEQRLLDAVARVEYSLTTEEIQRNSVRFDLLFVAASHRLAEIIRSLRSHSNTSSGVEQAMVWEKVDPEQSEGMNGYLASAYGDSQPPSFSSPIEGMEDVLDNQVICAIYKVPDDCRDSNITYPAPGVVLPKKTVQQLDMKVGGIWHEDGERRRAPMNIIKIKRYNPQGSISGPQLAKAAHKLVVHTLNAKSEDINEHLLEKGPPSEEHLQQKVSSENIIVKETKSMRKRKNRRAKIAKEKENMMLVNGLVGHTTNQKSQHISSAEASCPNTIIQNQKLLTTSEGENTMLAHGRVVPTTIVKSEDINSATALCSNTSIRNEQLMKKDPPSQEMVQEKTIPENIIVEETKSMKKRKRKKAKTASEGENTMLVNGLVVPTTNVKSELIKEALCPNTIIQNEQLLKKDQPPEENLQQKVSPGNIIVRETKTMRKKKAKIAREKENMMLVNGFVGHTTNQKSEHISSAEASCPNTIIQNQQLLTSSEGEKMLVQGLVVPTTNAKSEDINSATALCSNTIIQNELLKKDSPSQDNLQQDIISPECIIVEKANKKRKRKTCAERKEIWLANRLREHIINAKSEDISSAAALSPNTIIQNELVKKDSPSQDNLQQDIISPDNIIDKETKKKWKRKTKAERKEIWFANRLREHYARHTINMKSENISSAAALSPNTIIENELVKKDSPSQDNLQQKISPGNINANETKKKSRRKKKPKTSTEGEKITLVHGLAANTVNAITEDINSGLVVNTVNATTEGINSGLLANTVNATTKDTNSAAALSPNTIIQNQPLLKKDPPSQENLQQEISPEGIIVEKRKLTRAERLERWRANRRMMYTINAKSEEINSATAPCPNSIIENEQLLKKDPPSQENLQQKVNSENKIVKETKTMRKKKAKIAREKEKMMLVNGLVGHTTNQKSQHISSAEASCPNTIIQKQQPLKTEPPSQENLQQKVNPENKIVKETKTMRKKKAKIAREKENMMLLNGLVGHTTNQKSEDINSATAQCPNTIIQNQQPLKTEPPCADNLHQEISPETITLEKPKNKKRKRKTKTSSEEQRLVEHTITVKSEHINAAAEDTLIQNQRLLKIEPPVQEDLSQKINPQHITFNKRPEISREGDDMIMVEETKSQS